MNFRHVILTVFVLCGAFSAAAQTLVIYDARDLFPKDAWNPPCACRPCFLSRNSY